MPDLPHWWWFILLSLASWRVFRLLAEDTILDKPRRYILRLGDWQEEDGEQNLPEEYRDEWGIFLTCPYCAGFWISGIALTLYSLIVEWHGVFSFFVVWFSLSALVALLAKIDERLNEESKPVEIKVQK
jgi:hypothetical protein